MTLHDVRPRRGGLAVGPLGASLAAASREVWARGLTVGVFGNASARVPGSDAVLIKGTGVCMGEMTARDGVLVSLDGHVLEGHLEPSKELAWHLGIYRTRSDVGAVVHAHPPYATAWAVAGRVPPVARVAARMLLGPIPLVDVAPPGSAQLAELVTAAFGPVAVRAALLREHGTVTVGADLRSATRLAEHLEDAARAALPAVGISTLRTG